MQRDVFESANRNGGAGCIDSHAATVAMRDGDDVLDVWKAR